MPGEAKCFGGNETFTHAHALTNAHSRSCAHARKFVTSFVRAHAFFPCQCVCDRACTCVRKPAFRLSLSLSRVSTVNKQRDSLTKGLDSLQGAILEGSWRETLEKLIPIPRIGKLDPLQNPIAKQKPHSTNNFLTRVYELKKTQLI